MFKTNQIYWWFFKSYLIDSLAFRFIILEAIFTFYFIHCYIIIYFIENLNSFNKLFIYSKIICNYNLLCYIYSFQSFVVKQIFGRSDMMSKSKLVAVNVHTEQKFTEDLKIPKMSSLWSFWLFDYWLNQANFSDSYLLYKW